MNTAQANLYAPKSETRWDQAVLVVGAGVAGFRFIEEFRQKDPYTPIILFGDEPYLPYDRVKLSNLLAGKDTAESLRLPFEQLETDPNFQYFNAEITEIKPDEHQVIDKQGACYQYAKLILATGSRPHVPEIPGVDLEGVFTFRNMRDSERLKARTLRSRHTVILGGGLLGIEAARALRQHSTQITLIQQAPRLMDRQLDDTAAALLQTQIESQQIKVITAKGVRKIDGYQRVESITLRDGSEIHCDTVLISAGIRPNMEIARNAWIKVGRGIHVNDQLQTSDPDILAIGECAEHRGQLYGLASPGLEQAAIAANFLTGHESQYLGSNMLAKLKLMDTPVFSMGDVDDENGNSTKTLIFKNKASDYRKIYLHKNRLIGAIAIGDWSEIPRLQELITHHKKVQPWQQLRFKLNGFLWNPSDAQNPHQWPETAIICNCNGVSRGTLSEAIEDGCYTILSLSSATRAGTTCGSCTPLLQLMIGETEPVQAEYGWRTLITNGILTLAICSALIMTPGLSTNDSVQGGFKLEHIWNDSLIKQISGFSLISITLLGLMMSLRKRVSKLQLGNFSSWRLLHVLFGTSAIALLIAHTGFHHGSNLNNLLFINFLSISIVGALAGGVIALQYRLSNRFGRALRNIWFWAHLLLTWPLPALLGFHILSVYYF